MREMMPVTGGRPPKNLIEIGADAAAEHILRQFKNDRRRWVLLVDDYGHVRMRPENEPYRVEVRERWNLGVFNHKASIELIREALADRLEQIRED